MKSTKETNAQYHADKSRISNSMLSDLKSDVKAFAAKHIWQTMEREETKAMRLGAMVHALLLEPIEFERHYIAEVKIDKRSNAGKAAAAKWEESLPVGSQVVSPDEISTAKQCALQLLAHEEVGWLLQRFPADAIIEERIDFELDGVLCRCKPDLLVPSMELCIDIKTTSDASPEAFGWSIADFGYHRQQAFYNEGIKQKYGRPFRFVFAVVENKMPHNAACYELDELDVATGSEEVRRLLADYQARRVANHWLPDWSIGVSKAARLPRFYKDKFIPMSIEEVAA